MLLVDAITTTCVSKCQMLRGEVSSLANALLMPSGQRCTRANPLTPCTTQTQSMTKFFTKSSGRFHYMPAHVVITERTFLLRTDHLVLGNLAMLYSMAFEAGHQMELDTALGIAVQGFPQI